MALYLRRRSWVRAESGAGRAWITPHTTAAHGESALLWSNPIRRAFATDQQPSPLDSALRTSRRASASRWMARLAAVSLVLGFSSVADAAVIRLGVASNFARTMAVLVHRFEQGSEHRALISAGSTGKFYAQIKNGAPFDLFFAADAKRPLRLEREGDGVPGSRFTYAIGRVVLWSTKPEMVDATGQVLARGGFGKLAIANPLTAPYGLAAQQAMRRLGVWASSESHLVRGENIAQTYQFVASGNADLGFVALSQVTAKGVLGGSSWRLPEDLHQPIEQQVILLRNARQPEAAKAFLAYLRGAEARRILQRFGYGVPPG